MSDSRLTKQSAFFMIILVFLFFHKQLKALLHHQVLEFVPHPR